MPNVYADVIFGAMVLHLFGCLITCIPRLQMQVPTASFACIACNDGSPSTVRQLLVLITTSSWQQQDTTAENFHHAGLLSCRRTAGDHQQDQRYLHWSRLVFAAFHHCVSQQCQCEGHGLPSQGSSCYHAPTHARKNMFTWLVQPTLHASNHMDRTNMLHTASRD